MDSDIRHGGVNAIRHKPAAVGMRRLVTAAPSSNGAFPNFVNNGGPVIDTPIVFTSFWGALWSDAAHRTAASRLNQFCTDLLKSNFMNVLSQYGVGIGAGSGGFNGTSTLANLAKQLTNAGTQSTIQKAIDAGTIPEAPTGNTSQMLIVYLDEATEIKDPGQQLVLCEPQGDTAFGFHDFFTTTAGYPFYYAVVPALDDACVRASCPGGDATCSLQLGETQEQRRTQVTSHEFAEMATDPQLNAWYDPQNGENGDICNGESDTITVGGDTWTVQRTYSKYHDEKTNGATYCLAQLPSPIPRL